MTLKRRPLTGPVQSPCEELDVGDLELPGILPRNVQRRGADVGRGDPGQRPLFRNRDRDRAAARAEIEYLPTRRGAEFRATRGPTSNSVSGRGTSVAGVTMSSSDQNSRMPVM